MGENLFDKLDDYLIARLAEIIERECCINDALALARTCSRMNAIIAPMLCQLMLKNISRKLTYASDERKDYRDDRDQWIDSLPLFPFRISRR